MTCQNAIHRLESPVYFFIIFSSSIDDKLDSLLGLGQDKPPPNILFILSNPVQYHNKNRIYGGIGGGLCIGIKLQTNLPGAAFVSTLLPAFAKS